MVEHITEIDGDDLEDYRELLEEQTKVYMQILSFQKYIEDKYLAGLDLEDGDVYVDYVSGLVHYWA